MKKLLGDLERNLEDKRYTLKNILWHGLTIDEPLVFENIIKSCFKNPDRKKFPDFFKNKGWWSGSLLYEQNESVEYWLDIIDPEITNKFNTE